MTVLFWDVACAVLLAAVIWLYLRSPKQGQPDFKTWVLMPASPTRKLLGAGVVLCTSIFAVLIAAQLGLIDHFRL